MTAREVLILAEWLRARGFSDEAIWDCIHCIAGKPKHKKPAPEKSK